MTIDWDDQKFGSAYDPVLNGVAQGLARLFPPVEVQSGTPIADAHGAEAGEGDEDEPRDD